MIPDSILKLKSTLRRNPLLYWIYGNYIVRKRQLYLHPYHLRWGKRKGNEKHKPVLPYLEMHLASHCNLNCKGCSHFSPISEVRFSNISDYIRDLLKLKNLFSNIQAIRLLGGEPLMNQNIEEFLYATREIFMKANIYIATNGYFLDSMKDSFWIACRKNQIRINWSVYPPHFHKIDDVMKMVKGKGVIMDSDKQEKFRSVLNLKGDSDPLEAFNFCRSFNFAPFLKDGKVYICSRPALIDTFNNKFGTKIPTGGFIDIYDRNINGWDVLLSINRSAEICKYCPTIKHKFEWKESSFESSDWDIPVMDRNN